MNTQGQRLGICEKGKEEITSEITSEITMMGESESENEKSPSGHGTEDAGNGRKRSLPPNHALSNTEDQSPRPAKVQKPLMPASSLLAAALDEAMGALKMVTAAEAGHRVDELRDSLSRAGVVIITEISPETRAAVLKGLSDSFHDMFHHTAAYGECLAEITSARSALEGAQDAPSIIESAKDALRAQVKTRRAKEGHCMASFSYLRMARPGAEDRMYASEPGTFLDGVEMTHSPVYAKAFAALYAEPEILSTVFAVTGGDMVSLDSGMVRCREDGAKGKTKAKCTVDHVDMYSESISRVQAIFYASDPGEVHLGFVPGSHSLDLAGKGFCVPKILKSDTEARKVLISHMIAAPEGSLVLFAQGVVHGEHAFGSQNEQGLWMHPTLKTPGRPPKGLLSARLACGVHAATYSHEQRRALASYLSAGLKPESLGAANKKNQLIHANTVDRASTQFHVNLPPSPQALAALASVDHTCPLDPSLAAMLGITSI